MVGICGYYFNGQGAGKKMNKVVVLAAPWVFWCCASGGLWRCLLITSSRQMRCIAHVSTSDFNVKSHVFLD